MKLTFLFFFLIGFQFAFAQTGDDSTKYVIYQDEFGVKRHAPMLYSTQILLVKGDSIFFIPNEPEFSSYMNQHEHFDVILNKDSLRIFLQKHIKALMIIKDKKKE